MSTAPSLSSQRLPPASHPQHYAGTRYADLGYNGLQLRDAHEENPESILDEHVQRVMKTPGCQSPGTGRHSPQGHGRYTAKPGAKAEPAGPYHHKHAHHHHGAGGKPTKEQLEAEAALRVQAGLAWGLEAHHYASRARVHGDNMAINVVEALACRWAQIAPSKRTFCGFSSEKLIKFYLF